MENWTVYWQDVVAMLAGIFLMLTFSFATGDMTVGSGWLTYVCGGLVAMFAAGGFDDQSPVLSWAAAIFGVLAAISPFITALNASGLLLGCIVAGGAVAAVTSAMSALAKQGGAKATA